MSIVGCVEGARPGVPLLAFALRHHGEVTRSAEEHMGFNDGVARGSAERIESVFADPDDRQPG